MDPAAALEELRRATRPVLLVEHAPAPGRVALLSGSFDPPTVGHVAIAEAAARRADLVVLVYSVWTLPKEGAAAPSLLSEPDRIRALELVCRGRGGLAVGLCSRGLLADQAAAAAERFPGSELNLVMGSDKALQLLDPRWYEDRDATLEALFALAGVLYAVRAGDAGAVEAALARPENAGWRGRFERLDVPRAVAAVSSREVRERVRRGGDVSSLVPAEVLPLVWR